MIAEDHPMVLNTFVQTFNTNTIEVIGSALNGKILIDLVKQKLPDVVLLDLRMPELDGHGVLKIFAEKFPSIKTVILTGEYSAFAAASAIINGAAAYILKSSDPGEVIKAIETVYKENYYFNEIISKSILSQLKNEKKKLYYLIEDKRFSEREIELIRLFCAEKTMPDIADQLNISENTILDHKKNLFKKIDANNIVALVKYAVKHGIIDHQSLV